MRVLSYNTLFGGFDGTDRSRYEAQITLIRELRPDVLLLQEARDYNAAGSARWFETERQLGMRGFIGLAPQTGQNTAIFIAPSIRPMRVETDNAHFHHALLMLTAEVPEFPQPVTFISAHLCPNGAQIRTREAAYLIPHATVGALTLVGTPFRPTTAPPPIWRNSPPITGCAIPSRTGSLPTGAPCNGWRTPAFMTWAFMQVGKRKRRYRRPASRTPSSPPFVPTTFSPALCF